MMFLLKWSLFRGYVGSPGCINWIQDELKRCLFGDVKVPWCVKSGLQKMRWKVSGLCFLQLFFFGVFQAFKDSTNKKRHDFFPQPPSKRKIAGRKPRSNRVVENHWVAQPQPVLITYTSLVELWIKGMESCPLLNIEKNSNDHPYNECELHS